MSLFHRNTPQNESNEPTAATAPVAPAAGTSGSAKQLTADSSVGEWLADPVGGAIFREMLAKAGQDEKVLKLVRRFSLKRLQSMSQGQMTDEILQDMVRRQNAGEMPSGAVVPAPTATLVAAETPAHDLPVWQEKIVPDRFKGKTVIVTGAGSGIGRATASRVAREGGRVIAVDMAEDRLNEFKASLPDTDVTTVVANITKQEDIDRIIASAGSEIHALANVAGIMDKMMPLGEADDALWNKLLEVNLMGMVRLSRAALPHMLPLGNASIVNITSEAGLRGSAAGVAYTASKHAVIGVTKNTAFMYGPQGLRVNAVAPGGTATNISGENGSKMAAERLNPLYATLPDVAAPEQLAASITFLLSDDSTNLNGVILPSDGGWSAQ